MGSLSEEVRTEVLCGHICDLEAENAKLRELCVDLHKLADESYVPFASANKWMDEIVDIEQRMQELGIEVE